MSFSGTQITRLGAYGASRALYGSFAGRGAAPVTASVGGWSEADSKLNQRLRKMMLQQALFEDEEEIVALLLSLRGRR